MKSLGKKARAQYRIRTTILSSLVPPPPPLFAVIRVEERHLHLEGLKTYVEEKLLRTLRELKSDEITMLENHQ